MGNFQTIGDQGSCCFSCHNWQVVSCLQSSLECRHNFAGVVIVNQPDIKGFHLLLDAQICCSGFEEHHVPIRMTSLAVPGEEPLYLGRHWKSVICIVFCISAEPCTIFS